MKLKMHLAVRAPSEGARQLARWVARDHGGDLHAASTAASRAAMLHEVRLSPLALQRMIDGELVPGLALGSALRHLGGVTAHMFNRPANGGWFDSDQLKAAA